VSGADEREAWRAIFEPAAAGRYLYHYTPLQTAVEAILPEAQLRLSRFSKMRDPREIHWAFASAFFGDLPDSDRLYWETMQAIEEAKATVRILSLTEDRKAHVGPDPFGRGYVHPRLWEQYANNHVGVCLCLEKQALTTAVVEAVDAVIGVIRHRSVAYRDGEIARPAQMFDLQTVQRRGVGQFVEDHFDEHVDELFFTKLTDWESEVEYRYVARWDGADDLS
jgi:hypothetical protein